MAEDSNGELNRRPGTSLGGEIGFNYYKLKIERAAGAWEHIFRITQWNYAAFGATLLAMNSGFIINEKPPENSDYVIIIACVFVITASVASSVMVYLYLNYSYFLFSHARQVEKAWLRSKDGRKFVEEILKGDDYKLDKYLYRSEHVDLSREGIVLMLKSANVQVNLIPAVIALLVMVAVIFIKK
ncbi:hypothetical protein [Azospirillum brasilense]|uniref:hypothetical protein n=1 Tax=Azospirillum brasilense TaxID=192 RepID=UPI0011C3C885|nr:hypothetical protein [Azospirillum brasilense]NUB26190.1 hypothetical protein [Azospirillum brasilense]NUB34807.1 hypothetical protein [Azospirillum brasilense]